MIAPELVDTFGIAIPPEWVRLPLEPHHFERFVSQQRRRMTDESTLSKTAQRRFELVVRQLRNDCQRASVTLAATLIAAVDDEPPGHHRGGNSALLCATCTLSSLSRHSLGSDLPLTANTIAAAMSRRPPAHGDGTEIIDLDPPALVDIPAGPAVRLVRLHKFPPDPVTRQRLAIFVQHVLVPYDAGQRAAVITFSSSNPELAQPLSELFHAMIATFRLFGGAMPTDPLAPISSGIE